MSASAQLSRVTLLFQNGDFVQCQKASAQMSRRLRRSDPLTTARFAIWQADAAYWQGNYPAALAIASSTLTAVNDPEVTIRRHAIAGAALVQLQRLPDADLEINQGNTLCAANDSGACGELLRTQGALALERSHLEQGYQLYSKSLDSARKFHQPFDEAAALMNMAHALLLQGKPDQAIDLSNASINLANQLGASDVVLMSIGNLGWAYYSLGDYERALKNSTDAEQRALVIKDDSAALLWLMTSARIRLDNNDLLGAANSFQQALSMATEQKSKGQQITALEELVDVALASGSPDLADHYFKLIEPMLVSNDNHLDALAVLLARGKAAVLRHDGKQARSFFHTVENDPVSQISMRLGAEHELANLAASEGQIVDSELMYETALNSFESARTQILQEDSKLPFLTNAATIYDDYIHFLIAQGKVDRALAIADQSRARTLAQGLGQDLKFTSSNKQLNAQAVASKADATILFYWLGKKQSYLWAITPEKTTLFPLPPQQQIIAQVSQYRHSLTNNPENPLKSNPQPAEALFKTLAQPAAELIARDKPVMILADGELSQLNFETLIVPATNPHFWIEDVTLEAAPSLAMLAAAEPSQLKDQRLLMLGNAISADVNYPELPYAAEEMKLVPSHFLSTNVSVFNRQHATPTTYFSSGPERYAYIHFVAHGVASQTDPLASAIILSQPSTAQSSFKLYAKEIMHHPIDARLVTISACYGTGIRTFAGEGLVGLSWAFLRAGAHNTIGAMWAASDNSTPRLMDKMYEGIEKGQAPVFALRNAKLSLLHSHSLYEKPFYWAPFQLYTRL